MAFKAVNSKGNIIFISMFTNIMFMVIVKRSKELEDIKRLGRWLFICGRRKTGKTFFVKHFLSYDTYFFVNRDGTIFTEDGHRISYETFFELIKDSLGEKKIVIDEFHRLPDEFYDYLHSQGKKGELIAISSTLWLSKKLLGSGSPLLGLFSLYIFGLVYECDAILALSLEDKKEIIESAVYLREPMLAYDYRPPIDEFLPSYLFANKLTLKEIIGEIFNEEERRLSLVYEGILRAISDGKRISSEISSYLFSKKLIPKDNPGLIQRYLDVLVKIGLIEKIETNKRGFYYVHNSPLFDLHFYLDEKYGYTELDISTRYIKDVVKEMLPRHVEKFIWDLLAHKYGLKKVKIYNPEIDIALKRFDKLVLVGEVKWKKKITTSEMKEVIRKLSKFDCQKIIVLPDKKLLPKLDFEDITIIDSKDLIDLCKGTYPLDI